MSGAIKEDATFSHPDVGRLLDLYAQTLEERIRYRRYFYKDARLVEEEIITVESTFGGLDSANVDIEPQWRDYLLGLEAESGHLVDGSHLYVPTVQVDQVILPEDQKRGIIEPFEHYEAARRVRDTIGMDEIVSYGRGLTMLFYGPSGTGKTMMANAVANHLGKKLLLVNFPSLEHNSASSLRYLFREAQVQDALLFFDECEGLFNHRDPLVLTEIERHDRPVILATNRLQTLDEAMRRRIRKEIPFHRPGSRLRNQIWETHLPEGAELGADVNLDVLADRYEGTGGLIKNAVLTAIDETADREPDDICLIQDDLEAGARS